MFEYIKTQGYFAQVAGGMEELGAKELASLGARKVVPEFRGIRFQADKNILYRVNYNARLISRVLAPLKHFSCDSEKVLYRMAKAIDWPLIFNPGHTFAVFANVSRSKITHSKYAALCVKDAIADRFRDRFGKRPDVDRISPDLWINLYIDKDRAVISLDTSGGSLHKRGYRKKPVEASMQETLAAAIVKLSGWNGETPLYDPMCGSGTLICEAMMHYCRIPAGFLKKQFGFEFLPDFDRTLWEKEKSRSINRIRQLPERLIYGSDKEKTAVNAAKANCRCLPGGQKISLLKTDFRRISSLENRLILCNPPYGLRLKAEEDLGIFYREMGDFLKKRCKGSTAYIYFGNLPMIKKIGLKPAFKKPLSNGGLDGRLTKYEIY